MKIGLYFWLTVLIAWPSIARSQKTQNDICNEVQEGGFAADPTDCKYFYRCAKYTATKIKCPGALFFNHKTSTCDAPENVECNISTVSPPATTQRGTTTHNDICNGVQEGGFVADPTDCKYFYKCVKNTVTRAKCPKALLFNPKISTCDAAENVECNISTAGPTATTPRDTTTQNAICNEVQEGGFAAVPTDCNYFYRCAKNTATKIKCPGALLFNPKKSTCDVAENVECNNSTAGPTSTTPRDTTTHNAICNGIQEGGFVADPTDCKYFYRCVKNTATRAKCPGALLFNPKKSTCDAVENVECNILTAGPIATTTRGTTTHNDICNGVQEASFVADPTDCKYFYICVKYTATKVKCPGALFFNPKKSTCDAAENVECNIATERPTSTTPRDTTTHNAICNGVQEGGFVADPTDCKYFYRCVKNTVTKIKCPGALLFNPKKSTCDMAENVECNISTEGPTSTTPRDTITHNAICNGVQEGGFVADPTDCKYFYRCAKNTVTKIKCPGALLFNLKTSTCDVPENVECNISTQGPTSTTPRDTTTHNAICNGVQEGGFVADPTDCKYFYRCVKYTATKIKCPGALLFNPKKSTCDAAENVECNISTASPN